MMPPAQTLITIGDLRLPVVAGGSRWLVVEKPCGVSIHNDPGGDLCSMALSAARDGKLPSVDRNLSILHAVHRLDRETSGLVLLAGDSETLAFFGGQFARRTVRKRYQAILHGSFEGSSATRDWIEWRWPLTAAAAGRNDPAGKGRQIPCTTRLRILEEYRRYTLIECEPLTGRKHQIRRHAKLAGHPIVGDRRYGSTRALTYLKRHHDFDRLGLHAHALTIRLPGEDNDTTFYSNGLPQTMRRLLDAEHS